MLFRQVLRCATVGALATLGARSAALAATPTVEAALKYTPVQPGVDYDTPTPDELPACRISDKEIRGAWVVRGANGALLRQFADSNADNIVDTWSYYRNGLEVYRDVDADFDRRADQYRWFHTGGSKWGVDCNEDGKLDAWKSISAEEAAEEVVLALKSKDRARFELLLVSKDDQAKMQLPKEMSDELNQRLAAARKAFESLGASGKIDADAEFTDFGGQRPAAIPAGTRGIGGDLLVYENVWCMVRAGEQHQQVQLGSMVEIDGAWKLIDGPALGGPDQIAQGFFYGADGAASQQAAVAALNEPTEEMQKVLDAMQKLDAQYDAAPAASKPALNARRADLLEQLAGVSAEGAERDLWLKQLADTISTHIQDGTYPNGMDRLAKLEATLRKAKASDDVLANLEFRRLQAAWSLAISDPKADYAKVQEAWLKQLEEFVNKYRSGENVAEALYQLAMANEYPPADPEAAQRWYERLVKEFPKSPNLAKAQGAIRRLTSVGKPITLKGPALGGGSVDLAQYRGRAVVIHYWSTAVPTCDDDHEMLNDLYSKYGGRKFDVIGVNLDASPAEATAYLQDHKLPWKQIYEPGGMIDSRLATEMGIIQLPQMILVDEKGQVVSTNVLAPELNAELKKLIPPEVAAK
jgi:hypothetical protein